MSCNYLCRVARRQQIHLLWRPTLGDPWDEFVLELAVAAGCDAIVTHNRHDFRGAAHFGIPAIAPAEFLAWLREDV